MTKRKETTDDRDDAGDWYDDLHAALLRGEEGAARAAVTVARAAALASPDSELGQRYREQQADRARKGRETQRDEKQRDDETLLAAVDELAAELPDARTWTIARRILEAHDRSTDRPSISKLRGRIDRALDRRARREKK